MTDSSNVVRFKKPFQFNIGIAIFIIIIIYIVFYVISYFSQTTTSWYQVTQGTIASNNIYRGIALRDEEIITAPTNGYINYYVKNQSRVSVNDVVYSIDTQGDISQEILSVNTNGALLSESALLDISSEIDVFKASYSSNEYSEVSVFKNDLNSQILQELNAIALTQLDTQIQSAEAMHTFHKYTANQRGIVVYYTDGYETITKDDLSEDIFDYNTYQKNNLSICTQVETAAPVYKLIKSEDWSIAIPVSEETASALQEKSSIKIRFCKDDFTTNANVELIQKGINHYLILSLRTAMVRYANDRFLEIELLPGNNTGLKIPKTAITTKEFFTIPKNMFLPGKDNSKKSLLVQQTDKNGKTTIITVSPTVYYETDDFFYIDNECVMAGDVIQQADSSQQYIVGNDTDSLIGVYNINKGYAIFKRINIIYESDEYAIVEPKTAYGIALYDHIALDGNKVVEDQLIKK